MAAYLHVTWPNPGKVIKARAPKVDMMKRTHLHRPRDVSLYDILTNEKSIWQLLKKILRIKFGGKKTQNIIHLFISYIWRDTSPIIGQPKWLYRAYLKEICGLGRKQ